MAKKYEEKTYVYLMVCETKEHKRLLGIYRSIGNAHESVCDLIISQVEGSIYRWNGKTIQGEPCMYVIKRAILH